MYLHTSTQPIVRVWGVAAVAGGARGCLLGVEFNFKDLTKYTDTDNWLKQGKHWQCFCKMDKCDK